MVLKGIISVSHCAAFCSCGSPMSVPLSDQTSRRKYSHGMLEFCTLELPWCPPLPSLGSERKFGLYRIFGRNLWVRQIFKQQSGKRKPSVMKQMCSPHLVSFGSYTLSPLPASSISQIFSCLFHIILLHWIIHCVNLPIHLSVAHPRNRKPESHTHFLFTETSRLL